MDRKYVLQQLEQSLNDLETLIEEASIRGRDRYGADIFNLLDQNNVPVLLPMLTLKVDILRTIADLKPWAGYTKPIPFPGMP